MTTIASLAELSPAMMQRKLISFDIFETLIYRRYLRSNEVHDLVSAYALTLLGRYGEEQPGMLTLARYTATDALKTSSGTTIEEPSLYCVWLHLIAARVGPGPDAEAMAARIAAFEYDIELQNLIVVPQAAAILRSARDTGATVIAISDMYFSRAQIATILDGLGLLELFDDVYVSSDLNKTKQTGHLFEHVLADRMLTPADMVHIGDNPRSDVSVPAGLGIATVYVDQHPLLKLDRPAYGQRPDIHHDIADLTKLFLAQLLFGASSDRADQLYFLSRDGCLMNQVLQNWDSALVRRYFSGIESSDIFLSRAVSCWLNVNFQGEWLLQSIGHAFWLHHGRATPRQLSALLAIDAVPSTLEEDRVYESATDTFVVLNAYRDAGLSNRIRTAVLAKREQTLRYLQDNGFFAHQSVFVSDIGYSGTVVRDLNTFLLQEGLSARGVTVPRINFSCIATNGNYSNNAVASLPYVRFLTKPLLAVNKMPSSLAESFAWLEMFYKHPTYGPLLGYREEAGRIVPDFQEATAAAPGHPAPRVIAAAAAHPSDIVLLWMAAVDFWGELTDPLLARFASPDDDTIEQMLADVYEVDAVSGLTRTVVLVAPELSDEAVYEKAKREDYWIPGSLSATRQARQIVSGGTIAAMPLINAAIEEPRGALRSLLRRSLSYPGLKETAFDPVFYRAFYPDLRPLPNAQALRAHYDLHGRVVGRFGSEAEMREALASRYGALPPDFDYGEYLLCNRDVPVGDPARWHALSHYFQVGRHENRPHRSAESALDAEFDALVASGSIPLAPQEDVHWKHGVPARTLIFARHGVGMGPWVDSLDLVEFVALNHRWAGRPQTRAQAIVAFLEQGIDRLAPLSLDTNFDPEFYRALKPDLAAMSDAEAFRHWITTGSLQMLAPSEAWRLQRMIGRRDFPAGFDWARYAARHRARVSPDASRSDLLDSFLDHGDPDSDDVVAGENAEVVWDMLGWRAQCRGQMDLARRAYRRGLAVAPRSGRLWHRLGDAYFAEGHMHDALTSYIAGIESPTPDRWSFIKGIDAAIALGAYESGYRILQLAGPIWKDMEPSRQARSRLMQQWFDNGYHRAITPLKSDETSPERRPKDVRVTAFLRSFCERDWHTPSGLDLARADGRVLILSGATLTDRAKWFARNRVDADTRVRVYSREEVHLFIESLPGCSLAILNEVELDSFVVEALLAARGYGIRTIFWVGPLGRLPQLGLDLSDLAASDFMHGRDLREVGRTLRSIYAARLVDICVCAAPSLLPALCMLARSGPVLMAQTNALAFAQSEIRKTGRRVLLHLRGRPDRVGESDQGGPIASTGASAIVQAVIETLSKWPDAELLLDADLQIGHRLLLPMHGRVVPITDAMTADQRLAIVGSADVLIDLGDQRSYKSLWADAAFAGVPSVVAPGAAELADQDGVLAVAGLAALKTSLTRLLDNPAQAQSLGASARARLASLAQGVGETKHHILPVSGAAGDKKRILFVNFLAPPQMIGGATRVMVDNIGTLLREAGDRYEIAILAADEENASRSSTRCDSWNGVPVFRIATPQEIDMDWRTYNAEVDSFTRRVLSLVKPDIVHIHCLPRLSVAVVDACQALDIPYIVTLHDTWWLSDFPFLVDESGASVGVAADPAAQAYSARIGLPRSLERAIRLRRALHGATARISVSESFAGLYRDAGFDVTTVANGVSSLALPERTVSTGRIRMLHVGGTQHHKGAYLVEAALRSQQFENLSLTIIELGRDTGDETHTVWGNTPVTVIGKLPSDKIGTLYANSDVLLAPSTWPESFGLVSREALAAGLWVVATDLGSMGEAVVEGENGFVIDVSTTAGLVDALQRIDADLARYTRPPSSTTKLRSADDQGREMIALYDTILNVRSVSASFEMVAGTAE